MNNDSLTEAEWPRNGITPAELEKMGEIDRALQAGNEKAYKFVQAIRAAVEAGTVDPVAAESIHAIFREIWNVAPHESLIESLHAEIDWLKTHSDAWGQTWGALCEQLPNVYTATLADHQNGIQHAVAIVHHVAEKLGASDRLANTLREFVDNTYVPDADCQCLNGAPCSDCVDHSGTREMLANARAALVAYKKL